MHEGNPVTWPEHDSRHINYPSSYPSGTVVLVCGGVDSVINADAHPDAVLLFVNMQHTAAAKELEASRRLFTGRDLRVATVDVGVPMDTASGPFVPARNLTLACVAVHHGSDIVFGAMADDHSVDKTAQAFDDMSRILTAQSGRTVTVRGPLLDQGKAAAVRAYVTDTFRGARMLGTWSCYTAGPEHCGNCENCVKWWVAMRCAGLPARVPRLPAARRMVEKMDILSDNERDNIRWAYGGTPLAALLA